MERLRKYELRYVGAGPRSQKTFVYLDDERDVLSLRELAVESDGIKVWKDGTFVTYLAGPARGRANHR
jgi:hypothetical protein